MSWNIDEEPYPGPTKEPIGTLKWNGAEISVTGMTLFDTEGEVIFSTDDPDAGRMFLSGEAKSGKNYYQRFSVWQEK